MVTGPVFAAGVSGIGVSVANITLGSRVVPVPEPVSEPVFGAAESELVVLIWTLRPSITRLRFKKVFSFISSKIILQTSCQSVSH